MLNILQILAGVALSAIIALLLCEVIVLLAEIKTQHTLTVLWDTKTTWGCSRCQCNTCENLYQCPQCKESPDKLTPAPCSHCPSTDLPRLPRSTPPACRGYRPTPEGDYV